MAESAADVSGVLPPWETAPERSRRRPARRKNRRVWFGDLIQSSWQPIHRRGLYPFLLAIAVLGPASIAASSLELWLALPGNFILVPLLMAGFLVYSAALLGDGRGGQIGSAESVGAALTRAGAPVGSIVGAGLALGLLVAAGLHLRLVPGFLLLGLFALTGPAAAREGAGGFAAARRGFILAQRNLLGHLALGLAIGGLGAALYVVSSFLFSPLPRFFDMLAAVTATTVIMGPLAAVAFAGAYDLRERGGRLTVRPRPRSGALRVARATGQAVETTVAALGGPRPRRRRRVSYIPTQGPRSELPRYQPDAATRTVNLSSTRGRPHVYDRLDDPSRAESPTAL